MRFRAPVSMNSMFMVVIVLGLAYIGNALPVVEASDNALVMPSNFTESMQAFMEQLAQAMTHLHNKTGPGVYNFSGLYPHIPQHPNATHSHNNATHPHNVTNVEELEMTLYRAYTVLDSLKSITSGENQPTVDTAHESPSKKDSDHVIAVEASPTTLSTANAKPSAEIKTTNQNHRFAFNCSYNRLYSDWCMQSQGWYCDAFGRKRRKAGWGGPIGDPCETNCMCTYIADIPLGVCPLTSDLGIICVK